jgi:hypothetical protein
VAVLVAKLSLLVANAVAGQFMVIVEVILLQLMRKWVPTDVTVAGIVSGWLKDVQLFRKFIPIVVTAFMVSVLLNAVHLSMNSLAMLIRLDGSVIGLLKAQQSRRKACSILLRPGGSVIVLLNALQSCMKNEPMPVTPAGITRG